MIFQAGRNWQPSSVIRFEDEGGKPPTSAPFEAPGEHSMTIRTIGAAVALGYGDGPVMHRASRTSQEHGARLLLVHVIESLPATADLSLPADEEPVSRVLVADGP